jgi:anti-sigma factor RsiW
MRDTSTCRELEPLLAERASGLLAREEEARVAGHLAGCVRCRAEAQAYEEALSLALPGFTPILDAELHAVATAALSSAREADRRRHRLRWWLCGGLAATAAAALVLAPTLLDEASGRAPSAAHRWEAPDPDALWKAAGSSVGADDDAGEPGVGIFASYDGSDRS